MREASASNYSRVDQEVDNASLYSVSAKSTRAKWKSRTRSRASRWTNPMVRRDRSFYMIFFYAASYACAGETRTKRHGGDTCGTCHALRNVLRNVLNEDQCWTNNSKIEQRAVDSGSLPRRERSAVSISSRGLYISRTDETTWMGNLLARSVP